MAKTHVISYFDKVSRTGMIGNSITKLAKVLEVHRHTISNWLEEEGYYEDDKKIVFWIDNQDFIGQGKRNNGANLVIEEPIEEKPKEEKIVPIIPYVVQQPIEGPIKKTQSQITSESWAQARKELDEEKRLAKESKK